MNLAYEPLFTPFSIRNTRIKNRYFMAAMGTVTHNDEDGAYLPDAVDYFVRRAAGGVGLIITGANWVDNNIEVHSPGSFPCPTICPGKYIKAARELTDRVHAFDTKIFVQLTAGLGRSAMPAMIHDRKFVAPSTISNRWNPRIECRELTTEEVERLVEQFGVSAAIAKKCGYDGVEVHAVHEGYLLDCFAMSLFNKRTDKYGGDLNGRLRFAIEIVQKIKQYCGENFPVILRFPLKSYIKDLRVRARCRVRRSPSSAAIRTRACRRPGSWSMRATTRSMSMPAPTIAGTGRIRRCTLTRASICRLPSRSSRSWTCRCWLPDAWTIRIWRRRRCETAAAT